MNEVKLYKVSFGPEAGGCPVWAAVAIPTMLAGHFTEGNIIDIARKLITEKLPNTKDFIFMGLELMVAYNVAGVLTEDDL